jgi:hypothetical protein
MDHIYTDEELLRRLMRPPGIASFAALLHFEKLLSARRRELILEARRLGRAWCELAVFLRVSQQAVQHRWKRYTAPERDPDD